MRRRLPLWVEPVTLAVVLMAALCALVWAVYQAVAWFTSLIMYALLGLFVVGYGLDPSTPSPVILAPAPSHVTTV